MAPGLGPSCVQLFAAAPGKPVRWRLLSGNNREAGRSALSYPDDAAARAAVAELQAVVDDLRGAVRRKPRNLWSWQLSLGDEVLVVSGRDYDRMIRCEGAMAAFRQMIVKAPIAQTMLVSSARRWESRSLPASSHTLSAKGSR